MKKPVLLITLLILVSALWAQNRYALVIGNANYPRADDKLPNAINDTNDITKELKDLGFDVILKQNLNFRDMVSVINAFVAQLGRNRNSEGFFWYGGHAVELGGKNYLLPLDVNTEDEGITIDTSYSVTTLLERLEGVRNKVNVVVLDACRVPPRIGGDGRGRGDTARVIKTVPRVPPDLLIVYSTSSGAVAYDGEGKRNSPFTEAFKKHIKSAEPLIQMVSHVTTETLDLTFQRQRPYTSGSMGSGNAYYSLNPDGNRGERNIPLPIGEDGVTRPFTSVSSFADWLSRQTGNTAKTPYTVKLNVSSLTDIKDVLINAPQKYVYLDLSGSSITTIPDNAFYNSNSQTGCATLTGIIMINGVTSIGKFAFGYCTNLASITIPSSVTSIGNGAFFKCDSLASITIPSSVTSIESTTFSSCSSLYSVTIPNSVTSIGDSAFSLCTSLASITIPNSVTSIGGWAFSDCKNLTSVNIPDGVTSIEYGTFRFCESLTSVTIPSSVTSIRDGAFSHCERLTSINIPSSVTSIGGNAFFNCISLVRVNIPYGVTNIEKGAFYHCESLTSITIPFRATSIGDDAFAYCYRLANVIIPDSVIIIGKGAFRSCESLTSVTIPSSVTIIENEAFLWCGRLISVTFQGNISLIKFGLDNVFDGDLRDKFYARNKTNGTPGTYTRTSGGNRWTRK